jgi:hypothetical protein
LREVQIVREASKYVPHHWEELRRDSRGDLAKYDVLDTCLGRQQSTERSPYIVISIEDQLIQSRLSACHGVACETRTESAKPDNIDPAEARSHRPDKADFSCKYGLAEFHEKHASRGGRKPCPDLVFRAAAHDVSPISQDASERLLLRGTVRRPHDNEWITQRERRRCDAILRQRNHRQGFESGRGVENVQSAASRGRDRPSAAAGKSPARQCFGDGE